MNMSLTEEATEVILGPESVTSKASLLVEAANYRHDHPGPISYRSYEEIEPNGSAGAVGPKKAILQRAALDIILCLWTQC